MSSCCLQGFRWNGKPEGKESKLAKNDAYVIGSNKDVAIMIVHDVFGWKSNNVRLIADHYAKEADATVYVPDFFAGDVVSEELYNSKDFDVKAFIGKNNKDIRGPEIEACAKTLKEDLGFKKVGAMGFCYGGWAVFRLGGKDLKLVDAISTAHPSILEEKEIDNVAVPVQIHAPEQDPMLTPELKAYANSKIPTLGVNYDYQYYPGVRHGFASKCDPNDEHAKKAMERAKNGTVAWFAQHLHLH